MPEKGGKGERDYDRSWSKNILLYILGQIEESSVIKVEHSNIGKLNVGITRQNPGPGLEYEDGTVMGYKMDKVENGGSYSTPGRDSFYVICDVCPSIE